MKKWLIITLLVLWLPCFVGFVFLFLTFLATLIEFTGLYLFVNLNWFISLLDTINNAIQFNVQSELGYIFGGFLIMTIIYLIIIAIVTVRMHRKLQKKTTEMKKAVEREDEIISKENTTRTTYSIGSTGTIYATTEDVGPRTNWYRVKQAILWVLIAILAIFIYPVDAIRWLVAQKN